MKKFALSLLALAATGIVPAHAAQTDMTVAAAMQRCTINEECALVSNSCQDNCGFVPVNKSNLPTLDTLYQSRCGKPMAANPTCNVNPPMSAACVNSRCTIDTAYKQVGSAGDYQSGAYGVPEAPAANKVQANVQDSKSLTAYQLPQGEVKQNTVGTIYDRVYVPPSAPVSGGNYVPVGQAPVAAPAASAPVAVPPQAVPTNQTHATPPELVPPVAPRTPAQLPPVAAPAPSTTTQQLPPVAATPTVPPMTPSIEPSAAAANAAPMQQTYVAPAPEIPQAAAPIPSVGAPGVPQAPAGAKPIPPSDLKPAPTFVPPAGTASPVSAEDPGAPPPADTTLVMTPGPEGEQGMTLVPSLKAKPTVKSFSASNGAAKNKPGSYN